MLEKPLGSLGLGETTKNVMIGNIPGIRIVFRKIYLDIFIVGYIQVSLKIALFDKTAAQNPKKREDY